MTSPASPAASADATAPCGSDRQQTQMVLQARGDLLDAHRSDPDRGQFNGEGMPSSCRHACATIRALLPVRAKLFCTACARSTNNCTPS